MDGCFFQHFTAKCKMDFVLTQERTSSYRFYFKTKRTYVPLKNVLGTFKLALGLGDRYIFMWQSLEILNVFTTLTLKQIFWKTKTFLKKLQYRVQSTTNISIPKADLGLLTKRSILDVAAVLGPSLHAKLPCQKPIVRQIEWGVKIDLSQRMDFLSLTTLYFWKFNLCIRTSYQCWFDVSIAQIYIFILFVSASVLFGGVFSLWVSLNSFLLFNILSTLTTTSKKLMIYIW